MAIDERWRLLGDYANLMNLEGTEFREYQYNIIRSIHQNGNTLVVLPTGLGKTFIAVAAIAKAIADGKRALLMAPTKPLSEQHYNTIANQLKIPKEEILLLTGTTSKKAREANIAKVIVATPQTVANDVKSAMLGLEGFGVAVFDECHRAVGKYAYTYIANECTVRDILVVGLTASPGSKKEKIEELVGTLNIRHIEARVSTDGDVVKYIMPKYVHIVNVRQTDRIKEISKLLVPEIEASMDSLRHMGLMHFKSFQNMPKGRLIALGREIEKIEARNYKFGAIFGYVKLLNLLHAYDLLVVEGISPFLSYMNSLHAREKKSRAVEYLLNNRNIMAAKSLAEESVRRSEEHGKVFALIDVLKNYRGKSAIVFAQYRSTIRMLVEFLNNNGFSSVPFVGKKEGVTQLQQKQVIEDFRNRKFDILVASSIGEEGLDIPSVDLVVFYEAIPNEIRNIQRKGRTGRFRDGDIYILVAEGTKDEVYLRVSGQKEEKMRMLINSLNRKLAESYQLGKGQKQL
ncbi:MAG: DEAD/DEAH box helicase family protein [Candidatus Micrarchaeota archaeon]|nr:DEAD/DEAH box helicase family protein [Candidatus Micrarchaeota archaeon]